MTTRASSARSTFCAIAATLLLATSTASAQTAAPACAKSDEIRVMMFTSLLNNMVTYIAKDAGLFERNCLNATLVPIASGPAGMAQLQSGSIHFSDTSIDNTIIARHRGLPIKIVTGESSVSPYAIVARADLPLPNASKGYPEAMKDLIGKKIGIFALGTGSELFVKQMFKGAGIDPKQITLIAVGPTASQYAALENKAVDAVLMADPLQDISVAGGVGKIVVDLRKAGVGPKEITDLSGVFQVKVASDDFVQKNPDIVRRYVEANRQAVEWVQNPANRERLYQLMKSHVTFGQTVPNTEQLFRRLVDQYAAGSTVVITRKSIAGWNRLQVAAGNVPGEVPWADLIWSGAPQSD
ncbi:MAG: ABC transporter substrate-binding protein [Ramlibacter sp.]